jgi:hypothetical protein
LLLILSQFPLQPHKGADLPGLHAQLCPIWKTIVTEAAGNDLHIQPYFWLFNWDVVWDKLGWGLCDASYDRFKNWYGATKRRLDTEADTEACKSTINPAGSSATVTRSAKRQMTRK